MWNSPKGHSNVPLKYQVEHDHRSDQERLRHQRHEMAKRRDDVLPVPPLPRLLVQGSRTRLRVLAGNWLYNRSITHPDTHKQMMPLVVVVPPTYNPLIQDGPSVQGTQFIE